MPLARLLLVLATLATLAVPAVAKAAPVLGPQAYFGTQVQGKLDEKAEPANRAADYSGSTPQFLSTYVGRKAIEPTIALDTRGNAFYTASFFEEPVNGAGGHAYLMRSSDGGKSWETIEPATEFGVDPPRDLDPYVHGDPDFGRIFDIGLFLAGSYLSYSDDSGETWKTTVVSDPGVNDHQTIVTAFPPGDNPTLVPTDPAFPKLVYYCVNEVSRTGCTVSIDGGRTFRPTGGSAYFGSATSPEEAGNGPLCSALHGHIQADKEGRIYVPAGHCGLPYIAVTEDGGTNWERIVVNKDIRSASPHNEVAVDKAGNLFYTWIDPVHYLPWMATSTDQGKTWSKPVMIAPPGVHSVNFPTIVAGEAGRVAVYFNGSTDPDEESGTRPWNAYVTVSTNALSAEPLFTSNIANRVGDPIHRGSCRDRCGGVFDFADIQVSPVDGTIWATSSDSCTEENGCNDGYDGDFPASGTPGASDGFSIHQTGGPNLIGPLAAQPPATPLGAPQPGGPAQLDRTKPTIRLGVTKKTFRVVKRKRRKAAKAVTRFTYRLSESATVAIRIDRLRGKKKARRVGTLSTSGAKGPNRLPFTGKVGRAFLRRGTYRAVAVARDSAGNLGRSAVVKFRVR